MGKKPLMNLPLEPLAPTSSPCPTFPRNLFRRCHFDFGSSCATSMCSVVSPAPQHGPTRQTLNASRSPQLFMLKAFHKIAKGQARRAGASPSDTSQPRRPNPQGVPQWSSCCAAGTGFVLRLDRVTSVHPPSAFPIQHSPFAPVARGCAANQFCETNPKKTLALSKTPIPRKKRTQTSPP